MIKVQKRKRGVLLLSIITAVLLTACAKGNENYGLSPNKPQEIVVWHYYNGAQAIAFEDAINDFNNSVGLEKGIVVTAQSKGSIEDLTQSLTDSANRVVGAEEMPNIFQCYLDTAVELDSMGILTDLDQYVTEEEKEEYLESYIEEGAFGKDGAWKLFPVAKSSEILAVNKTDWDKFAQETGADPSGFSTWEGVARLGEQYYNWSGGKSFFGRDAMANYMIIGCRQLGSEIFLVEDGRVTINVDSAAMKRLWDNFYVPYIKGYYKHVGRYRSDDVKLGEIIACVCSCSALSYFPTEVTIGEEEPYPIDALILPIPQFEGAPPFAVLQGASMGVAKSNKREEYASVVFLRWLTEMENNIKFCRDSGYLPVKKEANDFTKLENILAQNQIEISEIQKENLKVSIGQVHDAQLFTSDGFLNGEEARGVLEQSMITQAAADRKAIEDMLSKGMDPDEAIEPYLSEAQFESWLKTLENDLNKACQ